MADNEDAVTSQQQQQPPQNSYMQSCVLRQINWREAFPFTHVFRSFKIATHPSKMFLGLVTLAMLYLGGRMLDWIWPRNYSAIVGELGLSHPRFAGENSQAISLTFLTHEWRQFSRLAGAVLGMNWVGPGSVADAAWDMLVTGPVWLWTRHPLYALIFTLWFLLIWSVFGGAIARIAAVHVGRDEKISIRQALRFSINKVLSFLFAPVIPVMAILFLGCVLALGGWLLYIKWVGPIALGALFFIALAIGCVMAITLLLTLGGFSLMFPTIAVEGSDSFDAISRSFSYVFGRPWRLLFLTAIAITYGALTFLFAEYFIGLALKLTHHFVGWWLGHRPAEFWPDIWPTPGGDGTLHVPPDPATLAWSERTGAALISFWVRLLISLLGAYIISFYFSANTIIYYLLRREVDATDIDDVYLEDVEDEFTEAPPESDAPPSRSEPEPPPPSAPQPPPATA